MSARQLPALLWPALLSIVCCASAQDESALHWPPKLESGKTVDSGTSPALLKRADTIREGVTIAKTAPTVDFAYFDCQTAPPKGALWSVWGDGLADGDMYYTSLGDHGAPRGYAFLYAYNAATRELKKVVDVEKVLNLPSDHYTPGKVHSRLDIGKDGWMYFCTHRGSTRVGFPANRAKNPYTGDWILRYHPVENRTEVVAHAPLPLQALPTGQLDPERLVFYCGTADGEGKKEPMFLAYDVAKGRVLYSDDHGPPRAMILSQSTGKVYFHGGHSTPGRSDGPEALVRFDPAKPGKPTPIEARLGLRAATLETPQGLVYTVDHDNFWVFDVKTERVTDLGPSAVGTQTYTTSLDADATGRYIYYIPGAHGGAEKDGTPVVQYDTKTKTRKVLAFLHPYLHERYGYVASGSFGAALSPAGDKLYITWNGARGVKDLKAKPKWNTCALTVLHIPASERP